MKPRLRAFPAPVFLAPALLSLITCACSAKPAPAPDTPIQESAPGSSEHGSLLLQRVASGLEHPWGLAFLPDGRMLVTERAGRLRYVASDGVLSAPIAGVPEVAAIGQGGLLDVALDPAHEKNRLIYLSFAEPGDGGAGTAVARARLGDAGLENVEVIFRQLPKASAGAHFGSRLVFDRAGRLYVTTGDRQLQPNVQRLDRGQGKIYRINSDGSIPGDNPFVGRDDALPAIWSYGHRNPQGAALHPATGKLWQTEHGARGGDELNIPKAGGNYGWPVISLGIDYSGAPIGSGKSAMPGMEQPIHHWTPSIAPSGMAFYNSERFPQWKNSLFVGALAFRMLVRLELQGERVVHEERLLQDLGKRIRDVRQGPDGYLYLLTDEGNGEILRVGLAEKP